MIDELYNVHYLYYLTTLAYVFYFIPFPTFLPLKDGRSFSYHEAYYNITILQHIFRLMLKNVWGFYVFVLRLCFSNFNGGMEYFMYKLCD